MPNVNLNMYICFSTRKSKVITSGHYIRNGFPKQKHLILNNNCFLLFEYICLCNLCLVWWTFAPLFYNYSLIRQNCVEAQGPWASLFCMFLNVSPVIESRIYLVTYTVIAWFWNIQKIHVNIFDISKNYIMLVRNINNCLNAISLSLCSACHLPKSKNGLPMTQKSNCAWKK